MDSVLLSMFCMHAIFCTLDVYCQRIEIIFTVYCLPSTVYYLLCTVYCLLSTVHYLTKSSCSVNNECCILYTVCCDQCTTYYVLCSAYCELYRACTVMGCVLCTDLSIEIPEYMMRRRGRLYSACDRMGGTAIYIHLLLSLYQTAWF